MTTDPYFWLGLAAAQTTRLIIRERSDENMGGAMSAMNYALEGVQFLMEQKMMRGVKQRAEGAPVTAW